MDWHILWWILAAVLVVAGLAGTILPAIPGVPLVYAGIFLAAWIQDFELIGWTMLGFMGLLTLIAWAMDFFASAMGAKYMGATTRSFWGATIGAIVGLFFGIPGLLLGPFIGAVLGELSAGKPIWQSGRAGVGAWLGLVFATAVKLTVAFLMIGIFVFRLGFQQFSSA